jgi:acetyl esterase/lipase
VPPLVTTDEAYVLRGAGEEYAGKLRRAGVDVASVRVAGMVRVSARASSSEGPVAA